MVTKVSTYVIDVQDELILNADPVQNLGAATKQYVDSTINASAIPISFMGAADGVATLDNAGHVLVSQIPAIALNDTFVVADQAAMLALAVQTGDIAVRTDDGNTYILQGSDGSVLGDWTKLSTSVPITTVNTLTGDVVLDSDDIAEGSSNLYFTEVRVSANTDVTANTTNRHSHSNDSVLDATTASFLLADETKLDAIEDSATADQTGLEIKTAYEGNADTNEFSDSEKAKLLGVESAATADQTNAEIKFAYESNTDTNEFSDAEQTKLAGITAGATDALLNTFVDDMLGSYDGHIIPASNITYDLGSLTNQWRDIYVGPGSFYVNGTKVLEDNSGTIVLSADVNQNLQILSTGTGDCEIVAAGTGVIQLKGTLQILAGKNIISSDGNDISFGNTIKMGGETITGLGLPVQTTDATSKIYVDTAIGAVVAGIDWKEAVATFADLSTTHIGPLEGWTASVNDEDAVYRYDGTSWVLLANGTVPLATASLDGKLSQGDFVKLAGIESGATADQSNAEIKSAYEANTNTNAFSDTLLAKLNGLQSGATVDQTASDIKSLYESNAQTNAFDDAEQSKLAGIESGATADQTDAQILAAIKRVDINGVNGLNAGTVDSKLSATGATANTVAVRDGSGNLTANVFNGESTTARFADLAERYEADQKYVPGTVVVFGGSKEITACEGSGDTRVAGVISTDPAFKMNSEAGDDVSHPYVALKGRVPCKIVGPVSKGDLLTTSNTPGYAMAADDTTPHWAIFAKALGDNDRGSSVIEVVIQ